MVLRVDVVAAALEGVYGGLPEHRVVALTPQGRQLDQGVVDELAGEEHLTLLSARFEHRFATWDLRAWHDAADFAVTVLRHR